MFAGTIVLRERTAVRSGRWPCGSTRRPGWRATPQTLDVSAVTDAQFGLVRSFLLRVADLSPEARAALSVRLATPLTIAMGHQAPPGVHADQFLQCVAAAYQRRHAGASPVAPAWAGAAAPPPAPPPPARAGPASAASSAAPASTCGRPRGRGR